MTPSKLLRVKLNISSCEQFDKIDNTGPEKKNVLDHKQLMVTKVISNKI